MATRQPARRTRASTTPRKSKSAAKGDAGAAKSGTRGKSGARKQADAGRLTAGRALPVIAAVLGFAGAALAGIGLARRRAASGDGSFGTGEHPAPDLAGSERPAAAERERAPEAFRPDPTAPVPPEERDALRPALARPTLVEADRPVEARADAEGGSTLSPQGGRVTPAEANDAQPEPTRGATPGVGNL